MTRLKCIAVDDEPLALDIIQDYIIRVPFLEFQGRFESAVDALNYMKAYPVELILLDIQMEELTGIQLLKILNTKPQVILTTAYASYALQGYELDVTDYLLKPISFERFLQAANKAYERFILLSEERKLQEKELVIQNPKIDYFFVKTEYRLQKVNFNDILYIEGQGDYLKIVTRDENIMTLQSFMRMEESLPASHFVRIHRSYIVALDKIDNIVKNQVFIADQALPVSNTYKDSFFSILQEKGII
ncbi:MAG: LytTR family DNA-binding domain-containing protein [Bacteroidales bacterium]|nr:LytTR family DNA-binding domain-containing protein [Bacteroidales bacterium]